MIRLAIATGVYYRPHETQINFHLQKLFGGNSVVIAAKNGDTPLDDRPFHIWGKKSTRYSKIENLKELAASITNYSATRSLTVPHGRRRQEIKWFLKNQTVDAILCEFGPEAIRLAPLANESGIPIFTYFRGVDASAYLKAKSHRAAYRLLMPRLAGVFSVSRFLLDNLAAHGISHKNSHVVPSGVDVRKFRPEKKIKHSFLSVGRFIEKKRPDITVRAFCDAASNVPEATLDMVGDGPMLDTCRDIAKRAGLSDRIVFHGRQPHDIVSRLMANRQVFLQHSVVGANGDTEGMPTSIQEAMASGMAVISTRHAGIPEAVVDGETGHLVDEGDEVNFADRIRQTLEEHIDIAAISAASRARAVEMFDNHRLIGTVEHEIQTVLKQRSNGGAAQ